MSRRILYLQHAVAAAYPPLEHGARILARAGWDVRFLGVRIPEVGMLRLAPHPAIRVRELPGAGGGWRGRLHYGRFLATALGTALRWRPRWVYASDPLAAPAALLVSGLPGVGVVYHEHDGPGPGGSRGAVAGVVGRARRALARRAALCVLPSAERTARFRAEMGPAVRAVTVWNCPARDEVRPPRAPLAGEGLSVLYHGSLVPARLPLAVVEALALLPPAVRLRLVGYEPAGHRGHVARLEARARQLGIEARLEIVGPVPDRAALLDRCAGSDVGLALMPRAPTDPNEATMAGASNKAFDYLACGLPVVVTDLPAWRRAYVEPGYGVAVDPEDPAAIARALGWFLEHPAETRARGEAGRRRVLDAWNYEAAWAPVRRRLEEAA